MNLKLIIAIISITLALLFYTVGVFSEKKAKRLNKNHVLMFLLGLTCDTIGTLIMKNIAIATSTTSTTLLIHNITGTIAILLMLFHALWAIIVLLKNDEHKQTTFHKFSTLIWIIWLIPYAIGIVIGTTH